MQKTIMLAPIGMGVGLTTVGKGLVRAFENQGIKAILIQPISYAPISDNIKYQEDDRLSSIEAPLPIDFVERLFSENKQDKLLEFILAHHSLLMQKADIAILQGMVSTQLRSYASLLNPSIAQALDAQVIFVTSPGRKTPSILNDQIQIAAQSYGGISHSRVIGCMINKIGAPTDRYGNSRIDLFDPVDKKMLPLVRYEEVCPIFQEKNFTLLASFYWDRTLMSLRIKDICQFLQATILFPGNMEERRALYFVMAGATVENMLPFLKSDVMIITPGDRSDVIIATCLALLNGIPIAALLLTGGHTLQPNTKALCKRALDLGLPIMSVQKDSLRTAISLQNLNMEIPTDDNYRMDKVQEYIASSIDSKWIKEFSSTQTKRHLSPAAFRFQITEKARAANKKIILPEGEDFRIIKAACFLASKRIANIVLLGDKAHIYQIAKDHEIELPDKIEIFSPSSLVEKYIDPLRQLKPGKFTEKEAAEWLEDPLIISLLMLSKKEVDGVVAGVHYTTAQTVRPALKLIRAKKEDKLVSSLFFMCLPDQVLVYADCAVNTNPSVEQLATIAIQTAESAKKFSISPRIALISYSTGSSGSGVDVVKVQSAVKEIKKRRPDLVVDGPLQYDAAFSREVAQKKAPKSPVAGQATVYIFPDLNTANTTYKAVQRSSGALSIGPVLQGLNQPVNDLSRGATIEDIIYTVIITAIQSINQ